jgi:translation initiation factor IF-1
MSLVLAKSAPLAGVVSSAAVVIGVDPVWQILLRRGSGEPDSAVFLSSLFMNSSKEEAIEIEGRIITVLAGTMFRVELDNKHLVLATICGKMRKRWVRLTVGDRVKMEMSPYDLTKARITWRLN